MKSAVTENASVHPLPADAKPIISEELPSAEETPVTFSNIFGLVGILFVTQLILLIIIGLVCRMARKIQQHRHPMGKL